MQQACNVPYWRAVAYCQQCLFIKTAAQSGKPGLHVLNSTVFDYSKTCALKLWLLQVTAKARGPGRAGRPSESVQMTLRMI